MAWLTANLSTLLIVIGIALLAVEVGVFGFSVLLLFFIGLACIVSGALAMSAGYVTWPSRWAMRRRARH